MREVSVRDGAPTSNPFRYHASMKAYLFAAATLLSTTVAWAQPAPPRTGPRLSIGVGMIGAVRVEGPNESGDGGLGLYFRAGVQINDLLGVENDLSGVVGLIPLAGVTALVRESIDLTLTPRDWFTVAAGPEYSWGISESASVVGGTLRVDFHFPRQRAASGARRAWTLGLGGDLGGVVQRNGAGRGFGWGACLAFGYAWY
jgi:hypothetical protein